MITAQELRIKFLEFFKTKGHTMIQPASLIPEHDPTVLFTTAGMQPLVPFLLGEPHPGGKRISDFQPCVRTGDIENIGDDWHMTLFEMLGNWSLGNYFKKEAIEWSFEFLTGREWLAIPAEKIFVSVFAGDKDAPRDTESVHLWQEQFRRVGIETKGGERIFEFGKEKNWWGPASETGPCGPDTEMFYDTGKPKCSLYCHPSCHCGKYAEIWNDVFMEYFKKEDGTFESLKQKNVDAGMGLERTVAVLHGFESVWKIELFQLFFKTISQYTKKDDERSKRIILDHLRTATMILAEGIEPSNKDQGYVLRRLIRRAIRHGKLLEIPSPILQTFGEVIIDTHQNLYPKLVENKKRILENLNREEQKFLKTLHRGLKIFDTELQSLNSQNRFSGKVAFNLYQTYGFPIEMIREELLNKKIKLNEEEFEEEYHHHQELSRKGAEKKFSGGLSDHSEIVVRMHTATHLLHQSLRNVLGPHVFQKGSNITSERLRFDFSHPEKLSPEEIKKVEKMVNDQIQRDLPVLWEVVSVEEAKKRGSIGLFSERYGDQVKVYKIGGFSLEICGGPHVQHTAQVGRFKIIKEEAAAQGVRRIKAVVE